MRQRGFIPIGLIAYAGAAIAVMGMIGYAYHTVKKAGADEVRAEWAEANAVAQQKADADRKRQEAVREAQDKEATRRLADAQKRSKTLMASLEAHIKASGTAAKCPVPPVLLDHWNAGNSGKGLGTGTVPSASPPATPAR